MDEQQQARIRERFQQVFGVSYEEGQAHVRKLTQRFLRMGAFAEGMAPPEHSRTSMSDRSFAMIAFFALMGVGDLEKLGLPELPPGDVLEVLPDGEG